jgi:hypothetical protein
MATIKKAQNSGTVKDTTKVETSPFQRAKQDKDNKSIEYKAWLKGYLTDPIKAEKFKKMEEAWKNTRKSGGPVKKMKNGGSLSGLKASNKRVGPVDPNGAFTKVQEKTLAGAKGKASLTKDKQLGATKMTAKATKKISKKK